MNAAEASLRVLADAGVDACFANPGTTELGLVAALDAVPAIRVVPTLFEGVATGAADGYGRMADRPALTLLHLGPGLGNGIANLHNARRARSPILNLIGDHPAAHRATDPPLTMDVEALARTVSRWVRVATNSRALCTDALEALTAAGGYPGQIATLIVPADCQWGEAADHPPCVPSPSPTSGVAEERIEAALRALREPEDVAVLLGGTALRQRGLIAAARLASKVPCRMFAETFPARMECGQGTPALERFPYVPELSRARLRGARKLLLVGAAQPVAYFAEEKGATNPLPEGMVVEPIVAPTDDAASALEALADALAVHGRIAISKRDAPQSQMSGPLNIHTTMVALAAALKEGAIVVDEGVSYAGAFLRVGMGCPPHSYLSLTGGATGMGLPCAVGAAIACPDRKVVALVGDGSAMYTLQALWTHARENLDVLVVVLANDGYRIVELEMARRHGNVGSACRRLSDFSESRIDWARVASGLGVCTDVVTSVQGLVEALRQGFSEKGPRMIVVRL